MKAVLPFHFRGRDHSGSNSLCLFFFSVIKYSLRLVTQLQNLAWTAATVVDSLFLLQRHFSAVIMELVSEFDQNGYESISHYITTWLYSCDSNIFQPSCDLNVLLPFFSVAWAVSARGGLIIVGNIVWVSQRQQSLHFSVLNETPINCFDDFYCSMF